MTRYTLIPRQNQTKAINDAIDSLNAVSPTMCGAKWQQATIHLQNGMTHSCHHPMPHKVPVSEVQANPAALHDSQFKKEQRKLMLEGERPEECDYCWRVEDNGSDALSDRVYKSSEPWSAPFIEGLSKKPWDADSKPTYIEVSFGNVCNFRCSYCGPMFSSKWMSEIEQHGPYPTYDSFGSIEELKERDTLPILNRDPNPYVDAFWEWWPDLYPSLMHFRITGGEPLMNQNTFRVMQWIIDNPRPELELSINSNMCVPDGLLKRFTELAQRIIETGAVKSLSVFSSNEAAGARADYIRDGMDYQKWLTNLDNLMTTIPDISITIMSTFNALSLTSYSEFLKDMLELRIRHMGRASNPTHAPLLLDFPYLRYPAHQAAYILTDDYEAELTRIEEWMADHLIQPDNPEVGYNGYHPWEFDKLKRVLDVVRSEWNATPDDKRAIAERTNFYLFFAEHDRRRGTDFLATFPEMKTFWDRCRVLAGG